MDVRDAASAVHSSGTGPSWKAVPTILSPRPSASSISVEVDLMVTTRSGAASKVTEVPQLSTVTGESTEAVGVGAAAGVAAQPARATTARRVTDRVRASKG